ncbi:MAG: hypothetical protein JST92_27825, partial [Deltaproteobacteria bacterium]|nr:hypothetical protein [Deltaproteobacteria bacterium]
AVRRAQVAFGPGLNVVFGPNDLGKSTLASAIQAALLVMPSSSEAASYTPWYADATPRVSLVFTDDVGRYWRVTKVFGSEQTAELHASKDGRDFQLDCKQRQVDGKIRELLAWGIPAPGGKGAPRGLPESFLSQVLLAPQTDVDAILTKSLASDAANTGHMRLNKALATLAQDPLFKLVLDRAQAEASKVFTPTWMIKKASELAAWSVEIKKLQVELFGAEQALQSSRSVEEGVNRLREEHVRATQVLVDAQRERDQVRRRLTALDRRAEVQSRVDVAQGEVDKLDAAAKQIDAIATAGRRLWEQVNGAEAALSKADAAKDAAERSQREAEEQLRQALSEDGGRQRQLEMVKLQKRAAELRAQLHEARATQERVQAALTAAHQARVAKSEEASMRAKAGEIRKALAVAEDKIPDAEHEIGLARALQAYGRWRVASDQAVGASKAAVAAKEKRAAAAQAEVKA